MAIVQNPFIGKAKGSLGNVTFCTLNDKNVMKSKAIDVHDAKTPRQLFVRGKFKKVNLLIKPIIKYINAAYDGSIKTMSPFNRLTSINFHYCFVDNTDEIGHGLFVLCDNEGSFVDEVVLTSTESDSITATFNSNAQNVDEGSDLVKAYGIDLENNTDWHFAQDAIRNSGTITLSRSGMSGLNIDVYLECTDHVNLLNDKPKHVIKYVGTVNVI